MKQRFGYLAVFLLVLMLEIFIGVFIQDDFIRPYVGDMLVTVLLCCLCRIIFPSLFPAVLVFLFSAVVEGLQWLDLTDKLGLQGTVLGIIVGSTFDWKDILCYALGCIAFAVTERLLKKNMQPLVARF